MADIVLYELGGPKGRRYSVFSWRARMALAHKGLSFESRPVGITDKAAIAFSGQGKVPIIVDGETTVFDSWKIAEHLERRFPDRPALFGGEIGHGTARFINALADRQLIPSVIPPLMLDNIGALEAQDGAYLRALIEKATGKPLEELYAAREASLKAFNRALDPLRAALRSQPYLCGPSPAYGDYIVFSVLQWARIASRVQVLAPDDAVAQWFERLLDAHGGLGRKEPARA
jgi:glutathione S-transferase